MGRTATIERRTNETDIKVVLDLDGSGRYQVETPIGFLTHMVEQLAKHGLFDLKVTAKGDTHIDGHHTTEDLAIALGQAFAAALGDKVGIRRYGFATLPMDEACVTCALDLSGRPFFVWAMDLPKAKIGDFDSELPRCSSKDLRAAASATCTCGRRLAITSTTSSRSASRRLRAPCARPPSKTRASSGCRRPRAR
jgi:imidazoleglycerol-phosphate dehydratase